MAARRVGTLVFARFFDVVHLGYDVSGDQGGFFNRVIRPPTSM